MDGMAFGPADSVRAYSSLMGTAQACNGGPYTQINFECHALAETVTAKKVTACQVFKI